MLDVRRLRVLAEVARHGSFSAAAQALGYTQPAISRQIAILEAEVGAMLVRRVPHGAVLTDAGRLLVERSEPIFARLMDMELELQALAGLEGGTLRLASFASAAASIVPMAVAKFRARHPKVELDVVMADPGDSLPRLRAGELDVALSHDAMEPIRTSDVLDGGSDERRAAGIGTTRWPVSSADGAATHAAGESANGWPHAPGEGADGWLRGVELVHLFDDPMYIALPAGHELATAATLDLSSFAGESWMLATTRSCPDSRLFLRACHAAGFEPRIALQTDDYPAILGFVAAGVGVALIPDMVARGVREDVAVRTLDPPPPPRPILAMLPAGYRSPAAIAMLGVLREVSEAWVAQRPMLSAAASAVPAAST